MRAIDLLKEWDRLPSKQFDRVTKLREETIACDCSGLINLLVDVLDLNPPYGLKRPKAVHYFGVLQEIGSNHISTLKVGNLLAWRKEVLPKSGDTGHVLMIAGEPEPAEANRFIVPVYDSSKLNNGLARRQIEIHTNEHGQLAGVRLHLSEKKVKKTTIYHAPLEGSRNCLGCGMPKKVCLCGLVDASKDVPPIMILRHPDERGRTLSTVSLIKQRYPQVLVKEGEVFPRPRIENPVLLFPGGEFLNVSQQESGELRRTFIILDATWRKAKKMMHLNPWMQELPKVSLDADFISSYLIRKVPDEGALSTVEAFSVVAEDKSLVGLFQAFMDKQIALMGEDVYRGNYSGHINFREE